MRYSNVLLWTFVLLTTPGVNQVLGQCARGQGGPSARPNPVSTSLSQSMVQSNSPQNYQTRQMQAYYYQQQLMTLRLQQQYQRQYQQQLARQEAERDQAVKSNRMARAEAKRAKRAERILARARKYGQVDGLTTSTSLAASASSYSSDDSR